MLTTFLLASAFLTGWLVIRTMVRHRRAWTTGLPEDVRRNKVAGPALGGSIWTGP